MWLTEITVFKWLVLSRTPFWNKILQETPVCWTDTEMSYSEKKSPTFCPPSLTQTPVSPSSFHSNENEWATARIQDREGSHIYGAEEGGQAQRVCVQHTIPFL